MFHLLERYRIHLSWIIILNFQDKYYEVMVIQEWVSIKKKCPQLHIQSWLVSNRNLGTLVPDRELKVKCASEVQVVIRALKSSG